MTGILEYVPAFTLTPRFILSARALYACQFRSQCGLGGIDAEFGFTSLAHGRGGHEATLVLAGIVSQSEGDELEQGGEIEMKERDTLSAGSGVRWDSA